MTRGLYSLKFKSTTHSTVTRSHTADPPSLFEAAASSRWRRVSTPSLGFLFLLLFFFLARLRACLFVCLFAFLCKRLSVTCQTDHWEKKKNSPQTGAAWCELQQFRHAAQMFGVSELTLDNLWPLIKLLESCFHFVCLRCTEIRCRSSRDISFKSFPLFLVS